MYYEDYELKDIGEFNKKMLQYMLWYNIERPHHSLNKKSPLQYFCDIVNSNKSEFSQTGMTYTIKRYLADESVLSKILNSLNIKDIYLARVKGWIL
jgi:hypothetical protein